MKRESRLYNTCSLSSQWLFCREIVRDILSKNITFLLSDIRGFSSISEPYHATDIVQMLNRYFDAMGE